MATPSPPKNRFAGYLLIAGALIGILSFILAFVSPFEVLAMISFLIGAYCMSVSLTALGILNAFRVYVLRRSLVYLVIGFESAALITAISVELLPPTYQWAFSAAVISFLLAFAVTIWTFVVAILKRPTFHSMENSAKHTDGAGSGGM